MTYVRPNFTTKKALKEALAAGERIAVFNPGGFGLPQNGTVHLEGPHAPKAHTWYAEGTMQDGRLVAIK